MKLNEEIDIVLKKLNGSDGADLHSIIPEWTGIDKSNTVDINLIVIYLHQENLIIDSHPGYMISPRGRTINDEGGWLKFLKRQKLGKTLTASSTWINLIFAAFNIGLLAYQITNDKSEELSLKLGELKGRVDQLTQHSDFQTCQKKCTSATDSLDKGIK